MSFKLLNKAYGLYQLSLLRIELNIDFDYGQYNWDNNNDYQNSTFVHEYMHYLQDISTLYGLLNFNNVIGTIQGCMNAIANSKENEITLPIDLNYIENYEQSKHLIEIYQGDFHDLYECRVINIDVKTEDIYKELYNDKIYEVILTLNVGGKIEEYRFGGRCVLESMAYLIESHAYPSESRRNSAPYNLCEEVANNLYEEFPSDKGMLVALCDISLNSTNPGITFYNILKSMKYLNFIPNTVDDVYKFVDTYIRDNTKQILIDELKTAMDRIDFIYPETIEVVPDMKVANKWLKDRFLKAACYRDENKKFITKIMDYRGRDFEAYFFSLLDNFGIPLIKDKHGEIFNGATVKNPDLNLTFVNVPITLSKLFDPEEKDNRCELIKICEEHGGLVDNLCIDAPWKKSENEILCPIGLIWYQKSLRGKNLIRK